MEGGLIIIGTRGALGRLRKSSGSLVSTPNVPTKGVTVFVRWRRWGVLADGSGWTLERG